MTAALERFKQKYAGTVVGKCFVLTVTGAGVVGMFAVGILEIWFTTQILGWRSSAALLTGGVVGIVVAVALFQGWIMWLVDWRQQPAAPMRVLFEEYW
ncbi:hypothetical protein GRX03_13415 [Halovenus sp. WSH3]|uniref:Uncharacterized protein n=1 Tax=Halovenus carboxidivorans TaxID=2692199 RepID=A0A6B0TCG2_9EURY|nr:hypothetical protein [Halovenus carboxidivorans]MXR52600.1 hypothetical protein [Halovenus carboxidivorans]